MSKTKDKIYVSKIKGMFRYDVLVPGLYKLNL